MGEWIETGQFLIVDGNSVYFEGEKIEPGSCVLIVSKTNRKDYFLVQRIEVMDHGYKLVLYGGKKSRVQQDIQKGLYSKIKYPEDFPLDPNIRTIRKGESS